MLFLQILLQSHTLSYASLPSSPSHMPLPLSQPIIDNNTYRHTWAFFPSLPLLSLYFLPNFSSCHLILLVINIGSLPEVFSSASLAGLGPGNITAIFSSSPSLAKAILSLEIGFPSLRLDISFPGHQESHCFPGFPSPSSSCRMPPSVWAQASLRKKNISPHPSLG